MPSFEIKGYKKGKPNSGPSLPDTGGTTKPLPKGHNYRPGSIDVQGTRLAYKMKQGFGKS